MKPSGFHFIKTKTFDMNYKLLFIGLLLLMMGCAATTTHDEGVIVEKIYEPGTVSVGTQAGDPSKPPTTSTEVSLDVIQFIVRDSKGFIVAIDTDLTKLHSKEVGDTLYFRVHTGSFIGLSTINREY